MNIKITSIIASFVMTFSLLANANSNNFNYGDTETLIKAIDSSQISFSSLTTETPIKDVDFITRSFSSLTKRSFSSLTTETPIKDVDSITTSFSSLTNMKSNSFDSNISAVPEPSEYELMISGLGLCLLSLTISRYSKNS